MPSRLTVSTRIFYSTVKYFRSDDWEGGLAGRRGRARGEAAPEAWPRASQLHYGPGLAAILQNSWLVIEFFGLDKLVHDAASRRTLPPRFPSHDSIHFSTTPSSPFSLFPFIGASIRGWSSKRTIKRVSRDHVRFARERITRHALLIRYRDRIIRLFMIEHAAILIVNINVITSDVIWYSRDVRQEVIAPRITAVLCRRLFSSNNTTTGSRDKDFMAAILTLSSSSKFPLIGSASREYQYVVAEFKKLHITIDYLSRPLISMNLDC